MKTLKLLLFILTVSCTHRSYRYNETFEDKLSRLKQKELNFSSVPDLEPLSFNKETHLAYNYNPNSGRFPASVRKQIKDTKRVEEKALNLKLNNRRLYFLSLLSQFHQFKKFVQAPGQDINSCPSFHSDIVHFNELFKKNKSVHKLNIAKLKNINFQSNENLKNYPELYLSMDVHQQHPNLLSAFKKSKPKLEQDYVSKLTHAIKVHVEKTKKELNNLCENGVGRNYFIYENLLGKYKEDGMQPSTDNLKILLRIPVFANVVILESLNTYISNGRSPASRAITNPFNNIINRKLKIDWMKSYVRYWKEKR